MIERNWYNRKDGRVHLVQSDGSLKPGNIEYTDDLPPSAKPVQIHPDWLNRFTAAVNQAIARSQGSAHLRAVGRSTAIEGEFIYQMFRSDGLMVTETAQNLAGVHEQTPGGMMAVAAYLDRVLGINQ